MIKKIFWDLKSTSEKENLQKIRQYFLQNIEIMFML